MAELYGTSLHSDGNLVWYSKLESTTSDTGSNLTNSGCNFVAAHYNNGSSPGTSNTSNYLTVSSNLGVGSGACTFAFWAKILTAPSSGSFGALFGLRTTGGGSNFIDWVVYYENSGGTLRLKFSRSKPGVGATEVIHNIDLGTSNFHHIAFTYDGTNIRGYVDGSLVESPVAASGVGSGGANLFSIHSSNSSGPYELSSAIIDDFGIFTRALSAAEVLTLASDSTTYVKTITAKARIKQLGVAKTVTSKARIKQAGIAKTVTSKARIKKTGIVKTLTARAYILGIGSKNIQAKARIFQPNIVHTIQAKAAVLYTQQYNITAHARIKQAGIIKTIQAKAKILARPAGFIEMRGQEYPLSMQDARIKV